LAGLTLGIGLRKQRVPVLVLEAGQYPRHRVCGEFISGRGQDVLEHIGLRDLFLDSGAIPARTAAFFSSGMRSPLRNFKSPALCLSRFKMDALLAEQYRNLGGELREATRWRQSGSVEPVVHASGRRVRPVENGCHWFGLKVHAHNVTMEADLEMHAARDGYVGLCRLSATETGQANICGLFRRRHGQNSATHWKELLAGAPGTALRRRFTNAVFDERSFCAVAGLPLAPQCASDLADCCIGDALTMIPPVTGNGMSMAFESADIALGPLAAYSRGELSWPKAQQAIARACDAAFAQRLAWAGWLQWMMFAPALQGAIGSMALHSGLLWRLMFTRTR
jgi:2-polyprenyl-6-methoxyphenol hydroxylase-like FAD-dependent oxidoreductase